MNQSVAIDALEERLRAFALAADPGSGARIQAERYLARLTSPVRVTLFGRLGVGKLRILEAAAGAPLLPVGVHLPMVELRFGQSAMAQITYADRSVTEHPMPLVPDVLQGAVLVVFELPEPILRRLSILDVYAENSVEDQRAAIDWAASRTDIALWCSENFDTTDQAIWSAVPDRVQDHAYLVLSGDAPALPPAHAGAFLDVCKVDLRKPLGEDGFDLLIERLVRHAELGREADADSAMMFLKKQEDNRTPSMPAPNLPLRRFVSERRPQTKPRVKSRPISRRPTKPRPESAAVATPPRPTIPAAEREVVRTGLAFLKRRSVRLLETVRVAEDGSLPNIPGFCGETLLHLSDLLGALDDVSATPVARLSDAVMDAEDVVILMENEETPMAAIEAVSVLQQVRHDFEAALAA